MIRDPSLADSRLLSIRVAAGKMLLTLVGLVGGVSIGREGPTVQIGAAVMLAIGRRLGLAGQGMSRALVLGGGAAGVAAAFIAFSLSRLVCRKALYRALADSFLRRQPQQLAPAPAESVSQSIADG